jgi:hypothetical protein
MEMNYTTGDGRMTVTFEAKSQADLFQQLAEFQEIFEDGSVNIEGKDVPTSDLRYSVRTVDGNDFFERRYVGPDKSLRGYKLAYGQMKEKKGHLFPKRKDENGWLKNDGWVKWEGQPKGDSPSNAPRGKGSTDLF